MERGCEGGSYGDKVGGWPHLEARWYVTCESTATPCTRSVYG